MTEGANFTPSENELENSKKTAEKLTYKDTLLKKLKKLKNLTPFRNNPDLLKNHDSEKLTERENFSPSGNELENSEKTAQKLALNIF